MLDPNYFYLNGVKQPKILAGEAGSGADWAGSEPLDQELKEITTLYNTAVAIGSSLNLPEVIWMLYKESSRLIDTSHFAIILYDQPTDIIDFALVFEQKRQVKSFGVKRLDRAGTITYILTHEIPLLVRDFLEAGETMAFDQIDLTAPWGRTGKRARSWLGVPIRNPVLSYEGTQGLIAVWSYEPDHFNEHDLWLLSAMGTQAAIAIRNARLYESSQQRAAEMAHLKDIAQRRVTEMALLNDIARTLSATLQFDEVLMRIMERVEGILKAEAGWLLLADPASGELVFQVGLGRTRAAQSFHLAKEQSLAGEVAQTGKPLLVADVNRAQRRFKELKQKLNFPLQSLLCVPLILYDQVIGVLEVASKRGDEFTRSDLELLNSIVPYAAIALKNARFHASVLAERDRVIEAEEKARRALARDLHDGPTQMVSAIMMRLDFCKLLLEKEPFKLGGELIATQELARQTIHQIRTLLFELRPLALEAQGLVAALQVFLERRQQDVEKTTRLSLKINTVNSNNKISRQDDKVEGAIFAILQEAVNNAIKHAQAGHIELEVEETFTSIYATVTDDGLGFEVEQVMNNYDQWGSLGMINIRERAEAIGGELAMKSVPGQGTHIALRVPKAKEERMKKRGATGPLSLPYSNDHKSMTLVD